jgi:spore coat protein JC
MFEYEKMLQYPVKIKCPNPALAKFIITQYGGPDGELGASMRYLSQRYTMPYPELRGLLTDIGTEELGHFEMVGAIVHQLTRDLSPEEIKKSGFENYFVDHTLAVYPQAASGTPWTAAFVQSKGDTITDLVEDLAAEQRREPLMTISFGWLTTRTSSTLSVSSANAKSCISNASAKP